MHWNSNPKTRRLLTRLISTIAVAASLIGLPPQAFSDVETEQKFETVFTSAGYSAALGAGVGLALLAFSPDPKEKLHYVTSGASIGFLSGTLLGGYLVLVPEPGSKTDRLDPTQKAVSPGASIPAGLRLDWTIAQF